MKLSRIRSLWCVPILAAQGSAISLDLFDVLNTYSQLSGLKSYINASPNVTSFLQNANNFTFLAPSNAAIRSFTAQNNINLTSDTLLATVEYMLLQGGFPTLSFTNTSQFVASNLYNGTYSNVTGGQRVELVLGSSGTPEIVTGNRSISTSTQTDIICTGGIVHIVDEVPNIPVAAVQEVTDAGFEFFIAILNNGGFLSSADSGFVNQVLEIPDVTFFLPNSAEALANATKLAQGSNATEQQNIFEYHIVPQFVGYSPLLTNGLSLKTIQGDNLTITVQGGDTYVNSAKIISSDYLVANGVVHVLDDLLNRFDTSPPPPPQSTSSTNTSSTSTSTPTPTPTSTSNTAASATSAAATPTQPTKSKGGLTTGAKAGIGVGVAIAGLLILAALAWFLLLRKREQNKLGNWNDQNMSGVPNDMGKFYVRRGTVQRQEDLGLGLQTTGMHGVQSPTPDLDKNSVPYSSDASGPFIPPRSPSRLAHGDPFF